MACLSFPLMVECRDRHYKFDVSHCSSTLALSAMMLMSPEKFKFNYSIIKLFQMSLGRAKVVLKNISRLCGTKPIVTINKQFQWPTLYVREGDRVLVKVVNHVKYNLSIHCTPEELLEGAGDGVGKIHLTSIVASSTFVDSPPINPTTPSRCSPHRCCRCRGRRRHCTAAGVTVAPPLPSPAPPAAACSAAGRRRCLCAPLLELPPSAVAAPPLLPARRCPSSPLHRRAVSSVAQPLDARSTAAAAAAAAHSRRPSLPPRQASPSGAPPSGDPTLREPQEVSSKLVDLCIAFRIIPGHAYMASGKSCPRFNRKSVRCSTPDLAYCRRLRRVHREDKEEQEKFEDLR
ncbi:hypothetical protein Scep_003621 [Stephania cephalantha]|uniref:Plastocyanin-like domain-containing protein n=1 Tax=Stephania cephalantha TaxID=152367 RepID=A0AAP0KQV0_9MAGN